MVGLFKGIYKGKTALITGNTGFKGSWLHFWLRQMGADTIDFSDGIPTSPSHWDCMKGGDFQKGDVGDVSQLEAVFKQKIDIVFHLAAQSLVRYSYEHPLETFRTNLMGTANLLWLCRNRPEIKGAVIVTSDKCYENFEDDRAYKEDDRMGGFDPYSASKGCTELAVSSFRRSYFQSGQGSSRQFILASGRAGNVIGGGDWSPDRLIPDVVKDAAKGKKTIVRNPASTRPWQHVLEPLSGYLLLGQKILEGDNSVSEGWNFGPENNETLAVREVLKEAITIWPQISYETPEMKTTLHEARLLRLDCTKAARKLQWKPVWDTKTAIDRTISWYKDFYNSNKVNTGDDLREYVEQASRRGYVWTK